MHLIDGRAIAKKIEEKIKKSKRRGGLAAILVGDDAASHLYVALKEKAAKRVNIKFQKILYPIPIPSSPLALRALPPDDRGEILEQKIINKIHQLNNDKNITGIIVQLPLPKFLDTGKIVSAIDPKKDADGFHPQNQKSAVSPVLQAAVEIMKHETYSIKRKKIVLVSNSKVFPIPFQSYFGKNLTVCKFKDIKKCLPKADIIITAIGKKHYLKSALVKNGAIIIDVGIVRQGKKIFGDADPKSLAKKRGWLTPVPGGVGPITVACLLKNTI